MRDTQLQECNKSLQNVVVQKRLFKATKVVLSATLSVGHKLQPDTMKLTFLYSTMVGASAGETQKVGGNSMMGSRSHL